MGHRSKTKAPSEAWYFQCNACGGRGSYVGRFETVKERRHGQGAGSCGGTIRITGRRVG